MLPEGRLPLFDGLLKAQRTLEIVLGKSSE